jgi:serine/threonine-protein kinase RsbW
MPLRRTARLPDWPDSTGFNFSGSADADDVRAILGNVMGHVPGCPSPDMLAVFELVLAEVLNNIIEHAFAGQPDGRIDIDLSATTSGLTCCIRDNGRAMPGEVLPGGDLPDICVDLPDLPEGGFGWHLIRSLTSDLTYRRSAGGNALSFTVPSI